MLLQWITVAVIIQASLPIFVDGNKINNCDCNANVCDCCLEQTSPKICARVIFGGAPKVELKVNGRSYLSRSISDFFQNAAPICIPVVPAVNVCLKVYGVQLMGFNNRACLEIIAQVLGNNVIGFDFHCLVYENGIVSLGFADSN